MNALDDLLGGGFGPFAKNFDGAHGRPVGLGSVSRAIRKYHDEPLIDGSDGPAIAAHDLARIWNAETGDDAAPRSTRLILRRPNPCYNGCAVPRARTDREHVGGAVCGTQTGPRATCRGMTVGEGLLHVADAGSLVERKEFQAPSLTIIEGPNDDFSAPGMLYEVGRKLGCDDGDTPDVALAEALLRRALACQASRFGDARTLSNGH